MENAAGQNIGGILPGLNRRGSDDGGAQNNKPPRNGWLVFVGSQHLVLFCAEVFLADQGVNALGLIYDL